MALYAYSAVHEDKEQNNEHGMIEAHDKIDAFDKLTRRNLSHIKLKRLKGWTALKARLSATLSS